MKLERTRALLPLVEYCETVDSSNERLRTLLEQSHSHAAQPSGHGGGPLPHGTLLVSTQQTAGRGRQGRSWVTPPHTAIAASMLLRPATSAAPGALPPSWAPLLAGSAVTFALQPLFRRSGGAGDGKGELCRNPPQRVGVKWPNDVHVRTEDEAVAGHVGAKLCGILCEALPGGELIVGFGINLLQQRWQLPTERAGSVLSRGGDTADARSLNDAHGQQLTDRVLAAAAGELLRLWELSHSRPQAAKTRVLRDSFTLGTEVRVHLPDGSMIDGRAARIEDDGSLLVARPTTGTLVVHAADIEHLR